VNSLDLVESRYDFFLIWGHGLQHKDKIIELIAKEEMFEIVMIIKHEAKNIKKLVKKVYEHDYVPYFHLKGKTKYLINTPREVMFIFVKNKHPREVWKLGHDTAHIESELMVGYKNIIRDMFNDKKDDRREENHVIHASDNELQVHHLLKYLGYDEGIYRFDRHKNKPFEVPHFIEIFDVYRIHKVNINDLICNTLVDNKHKAVNIEESPQYKFLLGFESEYKDYIERYKGTKLKAYYDLEKYKTMANDFIYLSKGHETNFVIVKKLNDRYIILDGLHRASLVKSQGDDKITIVEILSC
jgi:hypothetical protein